MEVVCKVSEGLRDLVNGFGLLGPNEASQCLRPTQVTPSRRCRNSRRIK